MKKVLFQIEQLSGEVVQQKIEQLYAEDRKGIVCKRTMPVCDLNRNALERPDATLVISDNEETCREMKELEIPVLGLLTDERSEIWGIDYIVEDIEILTFDYLERIYRRHKGIPWDILETERCYLREITEDDVAQIAEIYANPAITKFIEPLFTPIEKEIAYTGDYIRSVYRLYEYGMWVIIEKKSGKIIGRAGIEMQEREVELGYLIASEYQHKGYAYEVCTAILAYAKEELQMEYLGAKIDKNNVSSIRLCEKLGFQFIFESQNKNFYFRKKL